MDSKEVRINIEEELLETFFTLLKQLCRVMGIDYGDLYLFSDNSVERTKEHFEVACDLLFFLEHILKDVIELRKNEQKS